MAWPGPPGSGAAMYREERAVGRIKRMFFALDRALGGYLPPSEARRRAVRHPLPFGLAVALSAIG
ncbi:hypothetical protein SAMN05216489_07765 [Streptomyces sp. 3213]|nr:hypothetical protein SAMN05216489_07765 [Streptomyces sp. 3213] [Streptomyces sp. 3213.3]